MSTQTNDTSISRSLTVAAEPERAFAVFTDDFGGWFPREYNLLGSEIAERTFEPRQGGLVYDVGTDGSRCEWGRVIAYEPPARVVFGWAIGPTWQIEDDDSKISEVEVLFTPAGAGSTLVELEHRHLDRHGDGWEGLRAALTADGGWGWALEAFGRRAAGA